MDYEKIRTNDGKITLVRNPRETKALGMQVLVGTKCNKEGDTIFENTDGPYTEVVVFGLDDIKWRKKMIMNLHYGELEVVDAA